MSKYIAEYILQKEFRCRHCNRLPPDFYVDLSLGEVAVPYLVLFKNFKDIREEWNKPITLTGYRCEKHNKEIGGEEVSVHMFGLALDGDTESIGETQRLADTTSGSTYSKASPRNEDGSLYRKRHIYTY